MSIPLPEPESFPDEMLGRFWLSGEDESTGLSGFIRVDESGTTVHLEGGFGERGGIQDAVVYGRLLENGQKVSLINAFTVSSRFTMEGVVSSSIHSTMVAFGCHDESLSAHSIEFRLPYCARWFHEVNFETEMLGGEGVIVRFEAWKNFSYGLLDGFKLERRFSATVPGGGWGSERFEVNRPMSFRLTSLGPVLFDDLWAKMRQVERFFEFLSRNRMPPTHMALWMDPNPDAYEPDVRVFLVESRKPHRVDGYDDQLVHRMDVSDRLEDMLKEWGKVYEEAPDVVARYFSAFDRDGEDAILHLLWNAAAVEELHKVANGRGKKVYFIDRLRQTVDKWKDAFDSPPDDAVLIQIKDTRHYYAHAAGDLREAASKDWVLLRHGFFLQALATLGLLERLGFSHQEVVDVARGRYWLKEMLGFGMFPD